MTPLISCVPITILIVMLLSPTAYSARPRLSPFYYNVSCPKVLAIVSSEFSKRYRLDPDLAAPILRLFFHDAFVNGVDASLLLDNNGGPPVEKEFEANLSLDGFEVIEEIKAEVEKACPGVVSCADILTLATKFAVKGAGGPDIKFRLGRLDGNVSKASLAQKFLPNPTRSIPELVKDFTQVGLDRIDIVVLSGGHTIGVSHCGKFAERISGKLDPTLNPSLAKSLINTCFPTNTTSNTTSLDEEEAVGFDQTFRKFDNRYYKDLLSKRGLLTSDNALITDPVFNAIVKLFASDNFVFLKEFQKSMMMMSEINLDDKGDIRKICSNLN